MSTLDTAFIAALREAPPSVRVTLWMRTVEAVDAGGATPEVLAAIESVASNPGSAAH